MLVIQCHCDIITVKKLNVANTSKIVKEIEMSDYHVLEQSKNKNTVNVVFHIPVPETGTNQAELQWRDAIVLSLGGSGNIVSVLPGISTEEDTQLKAGALIEVSENVRFSSVNISNVQKKDQIEARFKELNDIENKDSVLSEKQIKLAWIGYAGDVV